MITHRSNRISHRYRSSQYCRFPGTPDRVPRKRALGVLLSSCLLFVLMVFSAHSQNPGFYGYHPEPSSFTTRYNLRRSENGRYIGHVFQESRTVIESVEDTPEGRLITGRVYVFEETLRDLRNVARQVNSTARFSGLENAGIGVYPGARNRDQPNERYPELQGFPQFPEDLLEPDDTWTAPGLRVLDPRNSGHPVRVPFEAEYRYHGTTEYYGTLVHHVTALYGLRYRAGQDPYGDPEIREIQGSHEVTLLFASETGEILLFRDMIRRVAVTAAGDIIEHQGFSLTWFDDSPRLDRAVFRDEARKIIDQGEETGLEVAEVPEGMMIRLDDIRFVADQAVILPEERHRLDTVARILLTYPDKTVLVVGHTADLDRPEGQDRLSVERAESIVAELTRRNVEPGRLLYEGRGAREPIAPNDTPEGRARNRRVEFIILD
jgi:OmpA-OmpF porin, OOP family